MIYDVSEHYGREVFMVLDRGVESPVSADLSPDVLVDLSVSICDGIFPMS